MKPYAPDKNDPFPKPQPKPDANNGNGVNAMPAFQPGQLQSLATDLNAGFGGGLGAWKQDLRNTFDPTRMSNFNFGGRNRGGGQNNGGGNNPGTGPNQPGDGGFDPSSPRNRMMPMAAQMPMQRPMQMQMPQAGLLNTPMQTPQAQGLLGDIPPEVLAFINGRR